MLHHIIAVRAAGARFEKWRRIQMTYSDGLQIGSERRGVVESEIRSELKPIGRDRNRGRHHSSPMIANMWIVGEVPRHPIKNDRQAFAVTRIDQCGEIGRGAEPTGRGK